MAKDYIQEAKDARKTFKGTNGEFVEKIGKPAMEAHNKAVKSKALEKKKTTHGGWPIDEKAEREKKANHDFHNAMWGKK